MKALVKKLSSENEELTIEKVVAKCKSTLATPDDTLATVKKIQELTYKKGYDDGSLKPQ